LFFVILQTGTLRYCGPTEFANGIWAGIELDDPGGKNDGSIGGISYFQCPHNHGNKNVYILFSVVDTFLE
jgi:dynactin complex subunit